MKLFNKIKKVITALIVSVAVFFSGQVFLPANFLHVKAETLSYSDVLDDLRIDDDFRVENYSSMTLDYFNSINNDDDINNDQSIIEIMTVSESAGKELYIYTYQPLNYEINVVGTAISMSLGFSKDGQDLDPIVYDLQLVSSYGVFNKYVLNDFTVPNELCRYYNIVCIYRNYIEGFDTVVSGGEASGSEYGVDVGQQWCAYNQNNIIIYEMSTFETLEIKIKYTGNFKFYDGLTWRGLGNTIDTGDLWFVAFDCDQYQIKHIFDAKLSYKKRSVFEYISSYHERLEYGDWSEDIEVDLINGDKITYKGDGLFAKEYVCEEISSSSDFIKQAEDQEINIRDNAKSELNNSQWVFAFAVTESTQQVVGEDCAEYYYDIEDVTVLRIKFMDIHDDVYNLGVVSDRVNPDNVPDGVGSGLDLSLLESSLNKILALVALVLIIALIGPFLSPILTIAFNLLGKLIGVLLKALALIFKFIWSILTFPFRMLKPK